MQKIDKSKLTFKMGRKYKLVPLIEKAIANFSADEWTYQYVEKQTDHHWHPSSHCTLPVSVLYEIATAEEHEYEPHANSLIKTFQVGHFWHQWLQYLAVKAKLCPQDVIEKYKILSWGDKPYEQIAGSADISSITANQWTGGVDFKTMNIRDFKVVNERRVLPEWVRAKYECQINIYMELFDQDEWMIFCIQKEGPYEFTELVFRRNQPLIDAIHEKFEYVNAAVNANEAITTLDDDHWPDLNTLLTGPVL